MYIISTKSPQWVCAKFLLRLFHQQSWDAYKAINIADIFKKPTLDFALWVDMIYKHVYILK